MKNRRGFGLIGVFVIIMIIGVVGGGIFYIKSTKIDGDKTTLEKGLGETNNRKSNTTYNSNIKVEVTINNDGGSNGEDLLNRSSICKSLFPKHNNPKADRINIVVVGRGYNSIEQFLNLAKKIFLPAGVVEIFEYPGQSEEIAGITRNTSWSFFSIEPLKSNKNKFNIWYIEDIVKGSYKSYLTDHTRNTPTFDEVGGKDYFPECGLDFVYPVFLNSGPHHPDDHIREAGSSGTLSNFVGDKNVVKEEIVFGYSYSTVPVTNDLMFMDDYREMNVVVHESGHSLFGLLDEYVLCENSYPNCASTQSEAEEWWGDLIGQVDPFYYEYKKFMKRNDLYIVPEERFRVKYNSHNEIDRRVEDEVVYINYIYPTENSIMRNNLPVFGAVNRKRAEQVLDLFSGVEQ